MAATLRTVFVVGYDLRTTKYQFFEPLYRPRVPLGLAPCFTGSLPERAHLRDVETAILTHQQMDSNRQPLA